MSANYEYGVLRGRPSWHRQEESAEFITKEKAEAQARFGVASAPIYWDMPSLSTIPMIDGSQAPMTDRKLIEGKRAFYRTDTGEILGIQSEDWTPVQPIDMITSLHPLIDSGNFDYESVCSLNRGKRFVVALTCKGFEADILKGDSVKGYLLAAQGLDGTMSFILMCTPVRVVCMNTLGQATLGTDDKQLRFYHTQGVKARVLEAVKVINAYGAQWDKAITDLKVMADTPITDQQFKDFALKLITAKMPEDKKAALLALPEPELPKIYDDLQRAYHEAPGAILARGTVWGAYNAVTELTTWHRGRNNDSRVNSSLFGTNAAMARTAHSLAMEMATA